MAQYWLKYGNSALTRSGSCVGIDSTYNPLNPLGLPPFTIRVKYLAGYSPADSIGDTRTLVDSTENIWDITKNSANWNYLFAYQYMPVRAVLGANTAGVTSMVGTFERCENLISLEIFDTSAVTNFASMLHGCSALVSCPAFSTQAATSISSMFMGCSVLREIPPMSTSNVLYMQDAFRGCEALTSVQSMDTSSVVNFNGTFSGCNHIVSVGALDTSSARDCWSMFFHCERLTTLPTLNLANCWRMKTMFGRCYVLENIDVRNTGLVTDWESAFTSCNNLKRIPANLDTASATNMTNTFFDCYKVESGALALYQQLSTQTTPPTNHTDTFKNCGSDGNPQELAQIPQSWGGTMPE